MSATPDGPDADDGRVPVAESWRAIELSRFRGARTGKITLLPEVIAAIVVARAERLAALATPGEAVSGPIENITGWDAARDEFRAAQRKVAVLADERSQAAQALSRLAALRLEAGSAYESITAADDALRALAGQRVAAERSLRAAAYRYAALRAALDAHARAKPGLRSLLALRFAGRREWRGRQALLDRTLRDYAGPVDSARRAVAAVQARFAATARERAEAAAVLRRLTAECAEAQQAIARGTLGDGDGPRR